MACQIGSREKPLNKTPKGVEIKEIGGNHNRDPEWGRTAFLRPAGGGHLLACCKLNQYFAICKAFFTKNKNKGKFGKS
ncbi:hypothetical protein [Psychrobacter ciconiae]|uniref:hypothetical protein n=1 Tax=Psychrobacter ciconiae TaxID=1553449 RepID=UPI001917B425|nr:hypothetical protein [Psychrobacter ciconiae]